MFAVSETMGGTPKFEGELREKISNELQQMVSLEDLEKRRKWRDNALTQLSQLKNNLGD
jgi:hypothetical protein